MLGQAASEFGLMRVVLGQIDGFVQVIFVLVVVAPEEFLSHSRYRGVPRDAVVVVNAVVERADQVADVRLHAQLRREACTLTALHHQALEEGDVEVIVLAKFVHLQFWPQLLVVADENNLLELRRRQHGHQLRLKQLAGLFDKHDPWTHSFQKVAVQGCEGRCHSDHRSLLTCYQLCLLLHLGQNVAAMLSALEAALEDVCCCICRGIHDNLQGLISLPLGSCPIQLLQLALWEEVVHINARQN
mmetsp:Transcript_79719/g.258256  ORF Transcript_79719/g.258256 Transcript_79719/m.258256 type:complete len:244 (-) Transcript_79719:88-819(-)